MLLQDPSPSATLVTSFLAQLAPILVPLVGSAVTWVLNRATGFISAWPNPLKQVFYLAFSTGLGFLASQFGADISSVGAFAASVVGLGLFHLGKASGGSK